jgi:toxin-antitoxin system PIN domain toxin
MTTTKTFSKRDRTRTLHSVTPLGTSLTSPSLAGSNLPAGSLLLDVNVLLALAWPTHQFHAAATRRLEKANQYWATCAITQLGFVRLSSNRAVVETPVSPGQAAGILSVMTEDPFHAYLDAGPQPVSDLSAFARIHGYKQVTDVYLFTFARSHGVHLLTFDARLQALGDVEVLT